MKLWKPKHGPGFIAQRIAEARASGRNIREIREKEPSPKLRAVLKRINHDRAAIGSISSAAKRAMRKAVKNL